MTSPPSVASDPQGEGAQATDTTRGGSYVTVGVAEASPPMTIVHMRDAPPPRGSSHRISASGTVTAQPGAGNDTRGSAGSVSAADQMCAPPSGPNSRPRITYTARTPGGAPGGGGSRCTSSTTGCA